MLNLYFLSYFHLQKNTPGLWKIFLFMPFYQPKDSFTDQNLVIETIMSGLSDGPDYVMP